MSTANPYHARISRVVDHIRASLDGDLRLEALARLAGFSPFHFHRIFHALTGETVGECVGRLRLERAVALLSASPRLPIAEAAFASGFSSASSFSRAFRKRYGMSPRQWGRQRPLKERKNGQVLAGFPRYTEADLEELAHAGSLTVRERHQPPLHLAVVTVLDSYRPERITAAYERLIQWYRSRGGDLRAATLLGMAQDDPEVTPLELCRYDLCLTVPDHWRGEGEVQLRVFPACRLAAIHCQGDIYQVDRAWQYLYRHWLPQSPYQPANLPALELYRRQPCELGWEQYDLECAIPIEPLTMI